MERPGDRLKRVRERLKLTYRDVEKASHQIALRRGSEEFAIALSRLADMENKQTVPSIYRIYSLSAIYRRRIATARPPKDQCGTMEEETAAKEIQARPVNTCNLQAEQAAGTLTRL